MAGTTAEAQVRKRAYRNQTAGWLGVVKLDHLGAQQGAPVAPHGTVYLSDEEAILTARAPADPKDNPFEEQVFQFVENDTGRHVEQAMRPLVLVTDEEGAPSDERYVPVGGALNPHAIAAEAQRTDAALDAQEDEPRTVPTEAEEPIQVPSPVGEAVSALHSGPLPEREVEEEQPESWVENPKRTEEPQQGSLGGSDEQTGADDADPMQGQGQRQQAPPPQAPVQQTVGAQQSPGPVPSESAGTGEAAGAPSEQGAVGEETAAATDSSQGATEETGAAVDPTGQAPEGEFAQHEEVGSPDAPAAKASEE